MTTAYSPILRSGRNEQQVIQSFGGFAHFEGSDRAFDLHPIYVVFEEDDLAQLPIYEDAGDRVYVDLPEYLGDKATRHTDTINETLNRFGSRESFFRENSDRIEFPLISGFPDHPVEYGIHVSIHQSLRDDYSRIGHRLMVTSQADGFSERQRAVLEDLRDIARPDSDVIMFDVMDVSLGEGTSVEEELEYLVDMFADFETGVLNAFDPLQDQPENLTPEFAERLGCSSFGDFAIDRRYPPDGGGRPNTINLPHYYPNHQRVEIFEGADYADAGANLMEWDAWDTHHCDFCTDIATMVEQGIGQDLSRGKRNRMGHYIESVLRGAI